MEFRAQQEHHHHQHHNSNNDQIRATSATSTLGGSFNRQQSPAAGGSRRSLLSNPTATHNIGNNNNSSSNANANTNTNASTLTSPNSCTTTTTTTTQTLDTNYQQVRPLQQVQLQSNNNNLEAPAAAAAKPAKPGAGSSSSTTAAKYRECLKNHAASVGGSVYDGCGEFMPSGDEGSLEALRCAACSCHRNFHRKESDSSAADNQLALYSPGTRRSSTGGGGPHNPLPLLPSPTGMHHMGVTPHHYTHHGHHHSHHQRFSIVQPMSVAYGGGNESSSEELNATGDNSGPPSHHHHHSHPHGPYGSSSSSKKRFRTKFTQEQKDRMLEFAERVGWRFQKQDEDEVERFCAEVGVKRQVLKVWMHNNKSSNVKSTKNQVDHVSIMMGNMGNSTSAGTATDAIMNQHVREEDDEGLD